MDELKIVKLAELRSRMGGIPGKLLFAFLIVAGAMCQFSLDRFKENILESIVAFFMIYGVLSYFWLFIKMTGNYLIGIIFGVVLIGVWQYNTEKMAEVWNTLIGAVICFGGPVLDVFTVIRYFILKKNLFSQMANYEAYGDEDDEEVDEAYEEYQRQQARREWQERQMQERKKSEAPSPGFFNGCKDAASIKRRYRDLCKVYHPDAGNGSSEVFNKITEEYNKLMEEAQ